MQFGSGLNIHLTCFKYHSRNAVLYKRTVITNGQEREYILSVHARLFAKDLVEALSSFAWKEACNVPNSSGEERSRAYRTAAVFVSGRRKSGKTTLVRMFERRGIKVVSASRVLRELGGDDSSRASLLEIGKHLLQEKGDAWFGERLYENVGSVRIVVFDGVRPPEAVKYLESRFQKNILIYLDIPANLRRDRYLHDLDQSISFDDLERHPIEMFNEVLKEMADLRFSENDNEGHVARLVEIILSALSP